MDNIADLMKKEGFPRSQRYDNDWIMDNQMGPNAVWLAEWLCDNIELKPGMCVLDLGCGKAMTSIFMAKEFGVKVFAADLWMSPDNNFRRVCNAGVEGLVYPIKAEAHSLPFPANFFDAVISIDAYQYFGTDQLYMGYISRFIKPGGIMGVVIPGLIQPIDGDVPAHLLEPQANGKVFWENECFSFKTAEWWKRLWETSGILSDVKSETMPYGWRHWRDFEKALEISGKNIFPSDAETLDKDAGEYIGFVLIKGRKSGAESYNLYDPGLGTFVGVDK